MSVFELLVSEHSYKHAFWVAFYSIETQRNTICLIWLLGFEPVGCHLFQRVVELRVHDAECWCAVGVHDTECSLIVP
jgi:hypothetical protein